MAECVLTSPAFVSHSSLGILVADTPACPAAPDVETAVPELVFLSLTGVRCSRSRRASRCVCAGIAAAVLTTSARGCLR